MSFDFLDADKDGRLPPSIVSILMVLLFILGIVAGWFAHANWSLRGEAAQIVEDMLVGDENLNEAEEELEVLDSNIEGVNSDERFTTEGCLNYSNPAAVRKLRSGREEEF